MSAKKVEKTEDPAGSSLWNTLLRESLRKDRPEPRHVVILGGQNAGKKSLWSRLINKRTNEWRGAPIFYSYTDVQIDEVDADEYVRVNVWATKSGECGAAVISQPLNIRTVERACVVLVVDLSQPRSIIETLNQYSAMLQKHVKKLETENTELMKKLRENAIRSYLSYKEPQQQQSAQSEENESSAVNDDDLFDVPLPEGVLTTNLGIPLIVVANKADTMEALERAHNLQDVHWECLQQQIRRFCIAHGAALIYTSVPTASNCSLLTDYVNYVLKVHPGSKLTHPVSVLHKDTVFVPAGWDTLDKVAVLLDDAAAEKASKLLSTVGKQRAASGIEPETLATEEQDFLKKHKEELERVAGSGSVARRPLASSTSASSSATSASTSGASSASAAAATGGGDRDKAGGAAVAAGSSAQGAASNPAAGAEGQTDADGEKKPPSEEALVNFFQSLLHRQPNTPLKKDTAADVKAAQVRKDAEQSLARLKTAPKQ